MRAFLATDELCLVLSDLPRQTIEALVEAGIAELDRRDGDPDAEDSGDAEYDCADMDIWLDASVRAVRHG